MTIHYCCPTCPAEWDEGEPTGKQITPIQARKCQGCLNAQGDPPAQLPPKISEIVDKTLEDYKERLRETLGARIKELDIHESYATQQRHNEAQYILKLIDTT